MQATNRVFVFVGALVSGGIFCIRRAVRGGEFGAMEAAYSILLIVGTIFLVAIPVVGRRKARAPLPMTWVLACFLIGGWISMFLIMCADYAVSNLRGAPFIFQVSDLLTAAHSVEGVLVSGVFFIGGLTTCFSARRFGPADASNSKEIPSKVRLFVLVPSILIASFTLLDTAVRLMGWAYSWHLV